MRRMVTKKEIAELGGTKLYKHTVEWGDGGAAFIISNISTPITDDDSFLLVIESLNSGYYSSADYNSGPILQGGLNTITYYDYELGAKTISEISFVSDTVTSL